MAVPGEFRARRGIANASHAAANTAAALKRAMVRQDQRIEAVSSALSPLAGWSLAKSARFGAGVAIVPP